MGELEPPEGYVPLPSPRTEDVERPAPAHREAVWRLLYHEHFEAVYRLARRLGVDAAEAEDIAQRVFLRAHDLLAGSDEILHPRAWLRAITVRVVSEHHRFWLLRRVKAWLVESTTKAERPDPRTPHEEADAAQQRQRVAAILTCMSPKLREVLVLAELEECTPSEVAAVLDIPVNTVRSRRQMTLRLLFLCPNN